MSSGEDGFYRPPESDLGRPGDEVPHFGSVERGLRGEYDFFIEELVSEAWRLLPGSKRVILGGFVIVWFVSFAVGGILQQVFPDPEGGSEFVAKTLMQMLPSLVTAPITAGIMIFAIKRAAHDPTASFNDVFDQFDQFGRIAGVMLLQNILMMLGFLCFVLPGIYLAFAYMLAIPLAAEKRMGIWDSLETSRKALTHCWFRLFGLWITLAVVALFGMILTLGIGLIWLLPFMTLCIAVLYRNVFGVESMRTQVEGQASTQRWGGSDPGWG